MNETVKIVLDGPNAVRIFPLGPDDGAFRAAIQGAKWDDIRQIHIARLDQAIEISVRLKNRGYCVEFGEQALLALKEKLRAQTAEHEAAKARTESVDQKLRSNGKAIRPYQREGVKFLAAHDRALLADEMRLGKTLQVLAAIPTKPRLLVVAPATVRRVWEAEALFWRDDIFPCIHDGKQPLRWPREGEMLICSYEALEELPDPPTGVTLVSDEAHMLKGKKSQRGMRFKKLARQVLDREGKVWLLTATPLLDRALDLYNILDVGEMAEDVFGTFGRFYKLFNATRDKWGTKWGQPSPEVHARMKKVMLRRLRSEVFPDLPPKQYVNVSVTLPAALQRAQTQLVAAMGGFDWLKGAGLEEIERASVAGANSAMRAEIAAAKIPAMDAIVEEYAEAKEPLVVFSAHQAPIEHLQKRKDYGIIYGPISAADRQRAIDDFQVGKLAGIALSIRSGGVGIKLTRASHVLFVDREWTPALNFQAQDRVVDVDDKTKRITITSLVGDHPLDARIEEIVRIKETLFDAAIDGRTE